MRINHFLKVEPPIQRVLIDLEARIDHFAEMMKSGEANFAADTHDESEEIEIISRVMNEQAEANPIEKGVSALLAFHNRNNSPESGGEDVSDAMVIEEQQVEAAGHLNLFSKLQLPDSVKQLVGMAQFDKFSAPLVSKSMVKDKIELLERVMGKPGSQANIITAEIIKDMHSATDYPPDISGLLGDGQHAASKARELTEYAATLLSSGDETS
jgi:intracellular multiplication protein IcmO